MIQIFYHIYFNFLEIVSWSWKLSGTFMNKIINQSMFNSKNKFQEFTFKKNIMILSKVIKSILFMNLMN